MALFLSAWSVLWIGLVGLLLAARRRALRAVRAASLGPLPPSFDRYFAWGLADCVIVLVAGWVVWFTEHGGSFAVRLIAICGFGALATTAGFQWNRARATMTGDLREIDRHRSSE